MNENREKTIIVSIDCITYNHENYIRDAIEGFLMQKTTFSFEVLIHDDASTDGTADIIREYEKKFPEIIKPIYQTENQYSKGIGVSKTYQFPRAKGKYIAFCEGDDYWTDPLKLQKQVDDLESDDKAVLSFHNAIILWEDGINTPSLFTNLDKKEFSTEDVIKKWFIPTASMVIKNGYFDDEYYDFIKDMYSGDWPLQLYLSTKGRIKYINKPMSVYRKQPTSLSFNPKITTEFVNNHQIALLKKLDDVTNFAYHRRIDQKINELKQSIAIYKLKKKSVVLYYLYNPRKSFKKILIKISNII